ncbi:hypothetical protein D3C87_1460870 [compost metagenome]
MMPLATRLGARQHETPVGLVCQGGPDLLPADQPVLARGIQFRPGLHVRQVRTGARFRIALAPELAAVEDAGQQALLLGRSAEGGECRADQAFADMAHASGATGAGIFLVEDHLLADRQSASAVFL